MADNPAQEMPPGTVALDLDKVLVSYQRQLGELHGQIATKDAMIEMQAEEIAKLQEMLVQAGKTSVTHHGRVTKATKNGKGKS